MSTNRDFAQNAHNVFMQSIGEEPKQDPPEEKDEAAVELGRKGGKARAKSLTPEQRSEIARKAVRARWAKQKLKDEEEE